MVEGETSVFSKRNNLCYILFFLQNGTMVHCPTGKCLAVVRDVEVILDDFKHEPAQFWYWVQYEH